jgi:hypothetical protein
MWKEILRDYDARHCCGCDEQIEWFRSQPSLRKAIEVAARATDSRGRRYDHQFRIRRDSIAHATAALIAIERQIAGVKSFDDLLDLITAQLREVAGIGELYEYDTAFRIGARLNIFPARVHLHSGTRVGARRLNLPYQKDALEMHEVPMEIRHRKPHEIEDILCIYKDRFIGRERSKRVRC